MQVSELLRLVQRLEIVARRNVTGLLAGNYVTAIRGRGLLFREARKYVPGEDVRLIDWNMTARCNEPYVRIYHDEREREIFIALDVSPTMRAGWQDRTKLEYAVELAATLAVSAVEQKDKLGFVLFTDRVVDYAPPRGGRTQLHVTLRALLEQGIAPPEPCGESDPRAAIHAIQRQKGKRFAVFMISDFIDHDIPDDFRYIQARHDVSLLHIYDPLEYTSGRPVRLTGVSPEGRARRALVEPGYGGDLGEIQNFLRTEAEKYRMAVRSFSTREPVSDALRHFFYRKGKFIA
jgi:uncharacterized protein (DUF58 family)